MAQPKKHKRALDEGLSSDEDSATNRLPDTWNRFLVVSSTDGEPLKLNPFATSKAIYGLAGDVQAVTKIRSGFLLIECKTAKQSATLIGLTTSLFTIILNLLMPKAKKLNYWRGSDTAGLTDHAQTPGRRGRPWVLTLTEELLLTLARLRRGFDSEVLAYLFQIDNSSVSRIFTTWISFMYHELQFLVSWPTRYQVNSCLPKCFKCFPKTRVIIDCTELFIQKPSLASSQRVTWSQYKHHNTVKSLVAISPSGTFVFLSNLYTGSISDRKIVQQSGFLDQLEYGDDIMADRGFLIRDLLTKRMCTLNIPPFSMGKQLKSRAVAKTMRIASSHIHVKRAIGRLKKFQIFQRVISLRLKSILDQMQFVCAALCNLDKKLVK
ncbi:uncharacterized protein [Haliotis asinina]|uniref:uncharacterized protein n=1 Tax=Haliotis asinina TaxID=109174 RepID=UPI00353264C6